MAFELSDTTLITSCVLLLAFAPPVVLISVLPALLVSTYVFLITPVNALSSALCVGVAVSLIPLLWIAIGALYQAMFFRFEHEIFQNLLPIASLLYVVVELFDGSLLLWLPGLLEGGSPSVYLLTALHIVSSSVQWVVLFALASSVAVMCWGALCFVCRINDELTLSVYHAGLVPLIVLLLAFSFQTASSYFLNQLLLLKMATL